MWLDHRLCWQEQTGVRRRPATGPGTRLLAGRSEPAATASGSGALRDCDVGRARKTAGTEQKNGWMALRSAGWMGLSGVARPEQPASQQSALREPAGAPSHAANARRYARAGR